MNFLIRSNLMTRACYFGIALIALASVYDAWLVYVYREVIDEENQFCRWLISLEPKHVSIFLVSKLLGTALVTSSLVLLLKYWSRIAIPTTMALVAFQSGLMVYLHTYDSHRNQLLAKMKADEQLETPATAVANGQRQARRWKGKQKRQLAKRDDAITNETRSELGDSKQAKRKRGITTQEKLARANRKGIRFPGERPPANRPRKRPGRRMKSPAAS